MKSAVRSLTSESLTFECVKQMLMQEVMCLYHIHDFGIVVHLACIIPVCWREVYYSVGMRETPMLIPLSATPETQSRESPISLILYPTKTYSLSFLLSHSFLYLSFPSFSFSLNNTPHMPSLPLLHYCFLVKLNFWNI